MNRKEIMDLLKKINTEMETTIIFVTHRDLSKYGTKTIKMDRGRIVKIQQTK